MQHRPRTTQTREARRYPDLRIVARHELLGAAPLPTQRFRNVHAGRTSVLAQLPALAADAITHAHRDPAAVRAGVERIAAYVASLPRAA